MTILLRMLTFALTKSVLGKLAYLHEHRPLQPILQAYLINSRHAMLIQLQEYLTSWDAIFLLPISNPIVMGRVI